MKRFLLLITLAFSACKPEIKPEKTAHQINEHNSEYLHAAIEEGDDSAYGTLLEEADVNKRPLEKLSLSILMNEKHKNLRSYYEVYRNLIELHNGNKYSVKYFAKLDSASRDYAFSYLEKGAKKNFISCQVALEKIYRNNYNGKGDVKKGDSLYNVLEHSSAGSFYKENRNAKSNIDKLNE